MGEDEAAAVAADAQMEGGCLPLSTQAVALALTPPVLAMLAPWDIQISLVGSLSPSEGASSPLHLLPATKLHYSALGVRRD